MNIFIFEYTLKESIMKTVNYIRLILGVLTLLGSTVLLFILFLLFLQDEVNDGFFVFFLVISYLLITVVYSILNLTSKEGLASINRLREENVELELKIKQMALLHKIEKLNENKD